MTRLLGCAVALATVLVTHVTAQQSRVAMALPLDPITAILEAFRTHSVVALGEGNHGNEQGFAFRLSLIRDPRFASVVNDIIVESGNALYQDVMDRFVAGDDVPYDSLRRAWQNTTQVTPVWDRPIYEDFFRAVRAVNAALPPERRIRVLLGDPPVDWVKVLAGTQDWGPFIRNRDGHAAEVVKREVLAKGRRGLIVYGDAHLFRAGERLVSILERYTFARTFNVITTTTSSTFGLLASVEPGVTSWRVPSLAIIRGTVLDTKQFVYYDALLYLGPPSTLTFSKLSPTLCNDATYVNMRLTRMAFVGQPTPEREMARECGGSTP
jgi:hypothetical protein